MALNSDRAEKELPVRAPADVVSSDTLSPGGGSAGVPATGAPVPCVALDRPAPMWAAPVAAGPMVAADPAGSTVLDVRRDGSVLVVPTAVDSVRATSVAAILDGWPVPGSVVGGMTGAD